MTNKQLATQLRKFVKRLKADAEYNRDMHDQVRAQTPTAAARYAQDADTRDNIAHQLEDMLKGRKV